MHLNKHIQTAVLVPILTLPVSVPALGQMEIRGVDFYATVAIERITTIRTNGEGENIKAKWSGIAEVGLKFKKNYKLYLKHTSDPFAGAGSNHPDREDTLNHNSVGFSITID